MFHIQYIHTHTHTHTSNNTHTHNHMLAVTLGEAYIGLTQGWYYSTGSYQKTACVALGRVFEGRRGRGERKGREGMGEGGPNGMLAAEKSFISDCRFTASQQPLHTVHHCHKTIHLKSMKIKKV